MNLVNELQISSEQDDVLTVIRKARRLASKLNVTDINDWLNSEQNGYTKDQEVPKYRIVTASIAFNTNGPIPAGFGQTMSGIMDYPGAPTIPFDFQESLREVCSYIETLKRDLNRGFYITCPDLPILRPYRESFSPLVASRITFMLHLNSSQIRAIPEAIKDQILDWACELERNGVFGENMSFSDTEKKAANSIHFNITGSNIEQLNNSGNNFRE